jgi:hypothetical protein
LHSVHTSAVLVEDKLDEALLAILNFEVVEMVLPRTRVLNE